MKAFFRSYLVDAVLLIILGVVLLVYPQSSLDFMLHWAGILLLVMGGAKIIWYFLKSDRRENDALAVSIGQALLGLALLIAPGFFKGILPFLTGVLIAYGAIVSLLRSLKARKLGIRASGTVTILSVITLVLALGIGIYMIMHPVAVTGLIIRAIGASLLLEGVTMLLASSMRS